MEIAKQNMPVLETGALMATAGAANSKLPKVTVGFTTTPEHKLELSKEADALNITLSALIQLKLLNFTGLKANAINGTTESENEKALMTKVAKLQKSLDQYQNNMQLLNIYNAIKGETHEINDHSGNKLRINVQNVLDTYHILVNSFQILKP